jgi:hypothetical protein
MHSKTKKITLPETLKARKHQIPILSRESRKGNYSNYNNNNNNNNMMHIKDDNIIPLQNVSGSQMKSNSRFKEQFENPSSKTILLGKGKYIKYTIIYFILFY